MKNYDKRLTNFLLFSFIIFANNAASVQLSSDYVYYKNFVRHSNGELCKHTPSTATFTAYLNNDQSKILIESAPRWVSDGDPNIPGSGVFGVELGNFADPSLEVGDSVFIRFTCLATGEQGVLTDTIADIPWNRFPRTLYLTGLNIPERPEHVSTELTNEGYVQIEWSGNPRYKYNVFRRSEQDTLQDGEPIEEYVKIANAVNGMTAIDSVFSADINASYIVYAEDSTGTISAHSPVWGLTPRLLTKVPRPILPSRPDLIQMYDRCWILGLENSKYGTSTNNFVNWYIDEAFDNRYFQWDICFAMAWAKYSQGALPNIESLDNFYRHQHPDGAISGVIREWNGEDDQLEDSPWFTRNNLFSWAEYDYYRTTGDSSRFSRVVPILRDYARWIRLNRRHPNGHFYWSGWSSGMDNSPRSEADQFYPPYSWIDYDANEALAAYYLVKMAEVVGDSAVVSEFRAFHKYMKTLINQEMWCSEDQFYWDLDWDGTFLKTKTVASFWPLWAMITDSIHVAGLVQHLNDPISFNRLHRVPTLAADELKYSISGNYWQGAVWAPTNHMIVQGLMAQHRYRLAREIVVNHLENMSKVFQETGTVWENYAPERVAPGDPAKPDFVGWSAVGPIAQLIENYIGINLNVPSNTIRWNLLTTEEVGLGNLKFGDGKIYEMRAYARDSMEDSIRLHIYSSKSFNLCLYDGTKTTYHVIPAGNHNIVVGVHPDTEYLPDRFELKQNYPNPFNSSTMITFNLPKQQMISLDIYGLNGVLVKTLECGMLKPGIHKYSWKGKNSDGETMSSGLYIYQVCTPTQKITRKMLLMK